MQCAKCHAPDPPIHITEKVGNDFVELDLCEKCVVAGAVVVMPRPPSGMICCPRCGMSVADLQAMGRMGCADDYEIFASSLKAGIEKYHGASQHVGKAPRK